MQHSDLEVSVAGSVARVAIVRPQTMNALRRETLEQLRAAVAEFGEMSSIRAMVLTGKDRSFSSGADLSDPMMGGDLPPQERGKSCAEVLDSLMHALIRDIRRAPFPVVAAVNGVAAGGGVGLALAADMVVAARSAKFVLTFTSKLGLVPDLGTSWQLAHHLGRARALGVVLTGQPITAEQAPGMGIDLVGRRGRRARGGSHAACREAGERTRSRRGRSAPAHRPRLQQRSRRPARPREGHAGKPGGRRGGAGGNGGVRPKAPAEVRYDRAAEGPSGLVTARGRGGVHGVIPRGAPAPHHDAGARKRGCSPYLTPASER